MTCAPMQPGHDALSAWAREKPERIDLVCWLLVTSPARNSALRDVCLNALWQHGQLTEGQERALQRIREREKVVRARDRWFPPLRRTIERVGRGRMPE